MTVQCYLWVFKLKQSKDTIALLPVHQGLGSKITKMKVGKWRFHVSSGRTNTVVKVVQNHPSLSLGKTLPWLKVTEPLLSLNFLLKPCSPLMTLASTLHLGAEKHSLKISDVLLQIFLFSSQVQIHFLRETVSCSWSSALMASLLISASGR